LLDRSNLIARTVPSFLGLVALTIVGGIWLSGAQSIYEQLLTFWGTAPFRYPFVDIDGSLAAWECARTGVDVIVANRCDVLQRGYNYSPFWMTLKSIPLGRPDRIAVGLVLAVLFVLSLSVLPPPLSRGEMLLRTSAVLSTMVAFAIERANPDLLVFILVIIVLELLRRSTVARGLGYSLAFLAGAIKYYPFVLLGLAMGERLRLALAVTVVASISLVLFWQVYAAQIIEGLPGIASGVPYGDMLAAKNFPVGLFGVLDYSTLSTELAAKVAILATILLLAVVTCVMIRLSLNGRIVVALYSLDERRRLALLAGALLLSGCFVAGQNVGYRGIFLLFVLPGMFALGRDETSAIAPAARLTASAIPVLMWTEAIRFWIHVGVAGKYPPTGFMSVLSEPSDFIAWCGREIAWWFLVGFLITILFSFVLNGVCSIAGWRNKRLAVPGT
jgi:hypothetical protein